MSHHPPLADAHGRTLNIWLSLLQAQGNFLLFSGRGRQLEAEARRTSRSTRWSDTLPESLEKPRMSAHVCRHHDLEEIHTIFMHFPIGSDGWGVWIF